MRWWVAVSSAGLCKSFTPHFKLASSSTLNFTCHMLFLTPTQQCYNAEGKKFPKWFKIWLSPYNSAVTVRRRLPFRNLSFYWSKYSNQLGVHVFLCAVHVSHSVAFEQIIFDLEIWHAAISSHNLHTKFELCSPTMKIWKAIQSVEFAVVWGLIVKEPFERASMTSYSTLIETMHLSCTIIKL